MVDEFSAFARMPAPVMRKENVAKLIDQAVFLQRTAHPQLRFGFTGPHEPVVLACDGRQVAQALTNLLKHAIESIEGHQQTQGTAAPEGAIRPEGRRVGKGSASQCRYRWETSQ